MGFGRARVEHALEHFGAEALPDVPSLIMWMVSNPDDQEPARPRPAPGAAEAPVAQPGAAAAEWPGGQQGGALLEAQTQTGHTQAPLPPAEFQARVADMLTDLLPRLLTFGKSVPRSIHVVADTLAFCVSVSVPLWDGEQNAKVAVNACLAELGDETEQSPPDALGCIAQIIAYLVLKRPQAAVALGDAGMSELLTRLQRWAAQSVAATVEDSAVDPFARGYRTFILGSAMPACPSEGAALLAAPAWLTPAMVCAHQLLSLVDLVKLRESSSVFGADLQRSWVTTLLDVLWAFPGLDSGLALACFQSLLCLTGTPAGARSFLEYQPRLALGADGARLEAVPQTAGGLLVLLRLAKQASFPGLAQMLGNIVLHLLEEDRANLRARMESEVLALFSGPGGPATLPIKDISRQLLPILSRDPALFEEALQGVTQRPHGGATEELVLEPIPEGERPQGDRKLGPTAAAGLVLRTLLQEACLCLEVQHQTTFAQIHEARCRAAEEAQEPRPQQEPPFPLALGSDAHLHLMNLLLGRAPGLGALLVKPPLAFPRPPPAPAEPAGLLVVDPAALAEQQSMLLVMMRHLLPRLASLAERWWSQAAPLRLERGAQPPQPGAGAAPLTTAAAAPSATTTAAPDPAQAEQAQPQGLLPRAASTASAASLETSPLAAAIADGARQRSAGSDGAAPAPPEALEQEVCTAEHEVQVLRGEVAAADREARQLHQLAREADRRLLLMADQTAKLSARVESLHSARSGSGVQEAAAEQMAEQTAALRRRLAWQEAELAKKDDEIAGRRLALEEARALLQDRRRQLAADDHGLGLEPPAASDAPARDRTQGIDAWVADMKASLERSKADAALLRERREDLRKQQAVQEQIDSLGLLLERAVARSQGSRGEIDKRRRRVEALEREARLLAASERLRRSKAEQQRLALEQESRELEDRIQQERARKDSRLQQASVRAYDQAEAESAALSGQLQALTVCMRDVYTVLQGSAAAGRADFGRAAVQDELAAALQDMQARGLAPPRVVRVGADDYEVDGKVVECVISNGGRLCVRSEKGGLIFFPDYVAASRAARGGS